MDSKRKTVIKSSVRASVGKLLIQARKSYREGRKDRAKRYVKMALDLLKKHRIRLPKEFKNSFCKKCCLVWMPGKTLVITYDHKNECLRLKCKCGYSKRI